MTNRLKINPATAIPKFIEILTNTYHEDGLELPAQVFLTDSRAEAGFVPGVRSYGNSDIDIVVPEPNLPPNQITILEQDIRFALDGTGVDFNFATLTNLQNGDAFGRVCIPISLARINK